MKIKLTIIATLLLVTGLTLEGSSQVIDIKKWDGYYPEMEGSYPLSFIAFKGFIIPIPYLFIRTWPTHYYIEADAVPVTDAAGIAEETATGLLRIATKLLEQSYMKGRYNETGGIKNNTELQYQVLEEVFNSRSDALVDVCRLAKGFAGLYSGLSKLGSLEGGQGIKTIFKKEADELMLNFLMVNLLETGHGDKLEAFSQISQGLTRLLGEVDYTYNKMRYFTSYSQTLISSYNFLTQ